VQQVQAEALGEVLARQHAADAVAARVERRAEEPDPELARADGQQPAGHAALGRQADAQHPLARRIVGAARARLEADRVEGLPARLTTDSRKDRRR
jgi:hypothetical protein